MTKTIDEFRDAWQHEIERLAVVEEKVGGAWAAFARGEGPRPAQELQDELSVARHECEDRLLAVFAAMGLDEQPLPAERAGPKSDLSAGERPAARRSGARAGGGT